MVRRIPVAASMLLLALFASGCCCCGSAQRHAILPPRPALINHAVFFKLHDPADAEELLADCDRLLATIPGVVSYYAGRHHDVGRSHVFSDYHVGMFVGFNSDADYAVYADHPNHIAAVEKWRPRWEWIRVYDVLDEAH